MCSIGDELLILCFAPDTKHEGEIPARTIISDVSSDDASESKQYEKESEGKIASNAKSADESLIDAPASLRSIPPDALHNTLLFCGPQSVTTGLGSTSKHHRSLCLTSWDSDMVWKTFFKWRCESKLLLRSLATVRTDNIGSANNEEGDELMPRREMTRSSRRVQLEQSTARLTPWNKSASSFENGRKSPDETYYSIYKRIHLDSKKRRNSTGMRCNRRSRLSDGNNLVGPVPAADNDPTLQQQEDDVAALNEAMDHPVFAGNEGLDLFNAIVTVSRLCGADAVEWCDAPSCRRARCSDCLGGISPVDTGRFTVQCGYCAIRLCKGPAGCAENNMKFCDLCHQGVCLDCEHISSTKPLGIVRLCVGRSGTCRRNICWGCARTVGRRKAKCINEESSSLERDISEISVEEGRGDRKMSPGERVLHPQRALNGSRSSGKFEALPFTSEKQFADATGQTLCELCAKEKVGKLNMYQRLDMSPRV